MSTYQSDEDDGYFRDVEKDTYTDMEICTSTDIKKDTSTGFVRGELPTQQACEAWVQKGAFHGTSDDSQGGSYHSDTAYEAGSAAYSDYSEFDDLPPWDGRVIVNGQPAEDCNFDLQYPDESLTPPRRQNSQGWWSDLTSSTKLIVAGMILQKTLGPAMTELASKTRDAFVVWAARKICESLGATYVPSEEGATSLLASLGHQWVDEAMKVAPVHPDMKTVKTFKKHLDEVSRGKPDSRGWTELLKSLVPGLERRKSSSV